jgi:hypothetical protein
MASNIHVLESVRNDWLNRLNTLIGSGAVLRVYSGTQPANTATAKSGNTLLAELELSASPFATASGGAAALNAVSNDSAANATGTATWASIENAAGTTRYIDMSCGESGADLTIDDADIITDGVVTCSGWTFTLGA